MSHSSEPDVAGVAPHPHLEKYYGGESHRRHFVADIFDQTARHYDRIDRVMSFGTGARYRRDALVRAGLTPGNRVLDVAIGTGLVARAAMEILGNDGEITGIDLSMGMLAEARKALPIGLVQGLAEGLPFADNSVDFVTMGYALRHVADLETTFGEYRRVLKPGGTLLILELSRPAGNTTVYRMTRFYMQRVVPLIARLGPGGRDSKKLMEYFWDTIDQCVPPATILQALDSSGFVSSRRDVLHQVFSEYVASKGND